MCVETSGHCSLGPHKTKDFRLRNLGDATVKSDISSFTYKHMY